MSTVEKTTGREIPIHNVLVIAEDEALSQKIRTELGSQGYEVTTAHSKDEALQSVSKAKPDLVLIDIFMKEYVGGVEILKDIRNLDPNLPVFVMQKQKKDSALEVAVKSLEIAAGLGIQRVIDISEYNIAQVIDNFSLKHFILEKVFNEKIKKTLADDARFTGAKISQLPVESRLEMRRRRNSDIELIRIMYEAGKEQKSIDIVAKKVDDLDYEHSRSTYEKRIYDLARETPLDCFVEYYEYVRNENRLLLESWCNGIDGKQNKFDKNTIEDKLHHWQFVLNTSSDKEVKIAVEKERRDELRKIIKKIAEMHFWMTYHLYKRVDFDQKRIQEKDFRFKEGDGEWQVEYKTKNQYKESFERYLLNILGSDKRRNLGRKLRKILYNVEKGKKDIFDWTETSPIVLVHGDLHPRQIVYKEINGEDKFKFVDLKNAKLGPGIIDFAFLQSPSYNCDQDFRSDLYYLYIKTLKEIWESEKKMINMPGISNIESESSWFMLKSADRIRQIYWDIRIVDKIHAYFRQYPYYKDALKLHTAYAKKNLANFIDDPDFDESYPQARQLYELLKGLIFENE
jgi:CheY-like chemotaxis protein